MTEPTDTQLSAPALRTDATSSTTPGHAVPADPPVDPAAPAPHQPGDIEQDSQSGDVKLALLSSAELATRAADLAAKAGLSLHHESQNLVASYKSQKRFSLIMVMAFSSLMLISIGLFGWLSLRTQSRIVQLDAMLLAVGKRVVAMDDSLEAVAATGDTLRDMSAKQDAISNQQARTDVLMGDVLKAVGKADPGKTSDPKSADILKLLQGIDAKVQAQSNLVKAIPSQASSLPRPALDASVVRREVEAALRQQRQIQEAAAKSNPTPASNSIAMPAAPTPPAIEAKPPERMVQYPRSQAQGSTTGTP